MARSDAPILRRPLPEDRIRRIRSERFSPARTQWDYLHLREILAGLEEAFARITRDRGPVLDLYCGAQPYRELIPWRPVYGIDIDRHFGRADVLARSELPFRTSSTSVVLCTQALYLLDDPERTVEEMARVLVPEGTAIITVPHLFRRECDGERRYDSSSLRRLFDGWRDVEIRGLGGAGTGICYVLGSLLNSAGRRVPPVRKIAPGLAVGLNVLGSATNRLTGRMAGRWPASFLLTAHPPDTAIGEPREWPT